MITAAFSNGATDTYKGKRDVKAAWAVIRLSDNTVIASGHSLDAAKAEATASTHLQTLGFASLGSLHELRYYQGPFKSHKKNAEAKLHNAKRLDAIRAATKIEVVLL
jgi:hypothetical protein